jgi:hypothetical protein
MGKKQKAVGDGTWTEEERDQRHWVLECKEHELRCELSRLKVEHRCIDMEFWGQRRKR